MKPVTLRNSCTASFSMLLLGIASNDVLMRSVFQVRSLVLVVRRFIMPLRSKLQNLSIYCSKVISLSCSRISAEVLPEVDNDRATNTLSRIGTSTISDGLSSLSLSPDTFSSPKQLSVLQDSLLSRAAALLSWVSEFSADAVLLRGRGGGGRGADGELARIGHKFSSGFMSSSTTPSSFSTSVFSISTGSSAFVSTSFTDSTPQEPAVSVGVTSVE
mmetsp:Transcript_22491/g.32841  ORF Transcript_22491/g.32841 Transcript_22491/m.32841 type:complete len:216 (+) Transcript_22491:506-1153(+)